MRTIITGDETWVYGYDPETKFQSSQWKHPESLYPKKARQVQSKAKVMLFCFLIVRALCITKESFMSASYSSAKKAAGHVGSEKFSAPS